MPLSLSHVFCWLFIFFALFDKRFSRDLDHVKLFYRNNHPPPYKVGCTCIKNDKLKYDSSTPCA